MTKVARLITAKGHIKGGKQFKTSVANIEQGLLVKQDSGGSTVSLAAVNNAQHTIGIAFGLRYREYAPTTQVFASGDPLAVVYGQGEILLSVDFFDGGSLPAALDNLYVGASGKWKTSGSSTDRVGHVQELVTWANPVGGTGSNQTLAHVVFSILP